MGTELRPAHGLVSPVQIYVPCCDACLPCVSDSPAYDSQSRQVMLYTVMRYIQSDHPCQRKRAEKDSGVKQEEKKDSGAGPFQCPLVV